MFQIRQYSFTYKYMRIYRKTLLKWFILRGEFNIYESLVVRLKEKYYIYIFDNLI